MDYDKNYIETIYDAFELNEIFIKEFIQFRKENNLTKNYFLNTLMFHAKK